MHEMKTELSHSELLRLGRGQYAKNYPEVATVIWHFRCNLILFPCHGGRTK